jgi:hypothetical protein
MANKEVTVGRNNSMYSFNPRRVGHIVVVHIVLDGVVHMGLIHIYASIARNLNYRRSGVQTTKKALHKDNNTRPPPPPPRQPQLAICYVEAGAKIRERQGGQTLGEDVGKLGGGRDMENPNIADGNPVTNEVQVDLHMLRPLVLNQVGGEVHGNDVVAVDKCGLGERVRR